MHEEALLRDLIRKAGEVAQEQKAHRVTRVRLWVGALAHLSEAQLQERWTWAVAGTPMEASTLEVEVSDDPSDPRATGIVLVSLDTERTEHDGPS